MGKSYRKTLIIGNTSADSDKPYKKEFHKRTRSKTRYYIENEKWDMFDVNSDVEIYNEWDAPKDGKHYMHEKELQEKYLRK